MNEIKKHKHLAIGKIYGEENTCGNKIDYKSKETAAKAASKLSVKYNKSMEAYPCYFCNGWHIGREISEQEFDDILNNMPD